MKNIILPIDFSDTTETLVEGAVDFAKEITGKIYLIHVAPADIGFAIGDMGFQYFPEIEKSEISEELAELNEIEKRIKAKGVGKVSENDELEMFLEGEKVYSLRVQ